MALAEREVQYDRQLRLWGASGQCALEAAHVCLAGAGALGTEAIKALALAGIGAITIVDGADVTEADIGANFFLEAESVGRNRASETLRLLLELNCAVRGSAVSEDPSHLLQDKPDFFHEYDLVLACGLPARTLTKLSENLWKAGVPLIVAKSVGFVSSLRIQVQEHAVVEAHPDNKQLDLRLFSPFPELVEYAESFKMDEMEFKDHAHVPWLVLLYQAVRQWSDNNGGALPQAYKQKNEVKEIVRSNIRKDDNGVPMDEENFEEAIRAVNGALINPTVPKAIKDILYDEACINLTQKSSPFWIMCAALRGFVDGEGLGHLPLSGALPDMTASTQYYVRLQNIYKAKAAADAECVYRRVKELVEQLGVDNISESDVRLICKNSAYVHLVRGSCLADEYEQNNEISSYVSRRLEELDPMMIHYVLMRASERFYDEQCRYPGQWDMEADIPKLKTYVTKLLSEWSCSPLAEDDYIREMCRYGGAELHTVSAFIGGCVAQEVIKLITKQYIPINNFFIHESVTGKSAMFTF